MTALAGSISSAARLMLKHQAEYDTSNRGFDLTSGLLLRSVLSEAEGQQTHHLEHAN